MDENQFFRQAVRCICGNLDFEIALQECLLLLRTYMPADMFHLNIYDRGLGALRNYAVATPTETRRSDLVIPLDEAARRHMASVVPETTLIIDDPEEALMGRSFSRVEGIWPEHSVMVMHLSIKGFQPGNLILYAKGRNRFTETHRSLFSILNDPFTIALSNSLRFEELNRLKDTLSDDLLYFRRKLQRSPEDQVVGEAFGLRPVMELVHGVAPLDSPVLLLGETGVGKEIIASAIHMRSRRKQGPFIKVNCGAIPESLMDTELFGHEKGAFTGAVAQKRGCFERAAGGTIFLDEVGELPRQAQVRMLRVLQEKKILRVGGSREIDVDIRIIAATHQNLEEMVQQNLFRADLRYRLNVFPITIPPLRERKEDIPALVRYFVDKKAVDLKIHRMPEISAGAMNALYRYHWPGNVRELENLVERALILNRGGPLSFEGMLACSLGPDLDVRPPSDAFPSLDEMAGQHIQAALERAGNKVHGPEGAAALLGINPSTLRHRMRKLGIRFGKKLNQTP